MVRLIVFRFLTLNTNAYPHTHSNDKLSETVVVVVVLSGATVVVAYLVS